MPGSNRSSAGVTEIGQPSVSVFAPPKHQLHPQGNKNNRELHTRRYLHKG
jgi:hypothetical protein